MTVQPQKLRRQIGEIGDSTPAPAPAPDWRRYSLCHLLTEMVVVVVCNIHKDHKKTRALGLGVIEHFVQRGIIYSGCEDTSLYVLFAITP